MMNTIDELNGKTYFTSAACMSVWSDALMYANKNRDKITKEISEATNVVVLSCQVTDLAVLNDLRIIERLIEKYPDKEFYVTGCLAKRNDIELGDRIKRLLLPKEDYIFISDKTLVNYEKPFWVKDFEEIGSEHKNGHLFRDMYPLKIGQGCPGTCSYCTIRHTRGPFETYDTQKSIDTFLKAQDVLLIADNPMAAQIKEWYNVALKHNKGFSIRNVEPQNAVTVSNELIDMSRRKLLKVFHSPIQSADETILTDMRRNVSATKNTIELCKRLKENGTFIATNIIIDYKNMTEDFSKVYELFDYVSWNPLWNGIWDREIAEERFRIYFGDRPNRTIKNIHDLEQKLIEF